MNSSLNRRQFLGASVSAGVTAGSLLALAPERPAQAAPVAKAAGETPFVPPKKSPLYHDGDWKQPLRAVRGVNLGAWLVLEKWMTPSVFRGSEAPDEYTLSQAPDGRARIEAHRESFITEADIRWIAEYGFDAVRLPVGYWVLRDTAPYFGAAKYVQRALDWAQKYDLKLLLDLHGAQGSQNGNDHSGRAGEIGWPKPENQAATLQTLVELAEAYGKHPALWGLEFLNEPAWQVPMEVLHAFTAKAYETLRPRLPDSVALVMHDGFRPEEWKGFGAGYENMILDTHHYQIYTDADRNRTPAQQIQMALDQRKRFENLHDAPPLIVGEWSISVAQGPQRPQTPFEQEMLRRAYGGAELLSFEATRGWFYWSYKTEYGGDWSFRDCVERGLLSKSMVLS